MSEDVTKIVMPESNSSISDMAALLNGNGMNGVNGMWNNPFMYLIWLAMFNNGGFGFGNRNNTDQGQIAQLQQTVNDNQNTNTLNSAINANHEFLHTINDAMNLGTQGIQNSVNTVGCGINNNITTQGYQNQISTLNQTNQLGSKLDANTASINASIAAQTSLMQEGFCGIKERELQSKIDDLTATNTALQNNISNLQQTNTFGAMLAPIQSELNSIKAAQPSTIAVQYPQVTAVPTASLYGYNSGSLWS